MPAGRACPEHAADKAASLLANGAGPLKSVLKLNKSDGCHGKSFFGSGCCPESIATSSSVAESEDQDRVRATAEASKLVAKVLAS